MRTKHEAQLKQLAALEKAKLNLDEQVLTLKGAVDDEAKSRAKANAARAAVEAELDELRERADEEEEKRLEVERAKQKAEQALEELRKTAEKDALERDSLSDKCKQLERDLVALKDEHLATSSTATSLDAVAKRHKSEIDELNQRVDAEQRARANADKTRKAAEALNAELRGKLVRMRSVLLPGSGWRWISPPM